MQLSVLLKATCDLPSAMDRAVSRLILDSRKVQQNDLFIALVGTKTDGRRFISEAIAKGAVAVLIDTNKQDEAITLEANIPIIPIFALRKKLGEIAARFYDEPAKSLKMIGVTGTSGKTTCTHFIAQVLQAEHISTGIIGTIGSGLYEHLGEAALTTPDAITLQATLSDLLAQGAKAVAMEVSSHSIDQDRIHGIPFELGLFTNLSQDHLDYHGDMESYAAVKRRFFTDFPIKQLIINADDAYGLKWINELANEKPIIAYTMHAAKLVKDLPLVSAKIHSLSLAGIQVEIKSPWGEGRLILPLIGEFNVSNVLASLAALCHLGLSFEKVLSHLAVLKPVPGRMQMLGGGNKPRVVVDYAHKPDALEKVLQALRAQAKGQVLCVFGCGGERDQGKRPKMAKIAENLADKVIVTNDNPRHEQPEAIIAQILQGFSSPEVVTVEPDRSKAIQKSIQWAKANDCVLIAGKGAEHYQQIGDEKLPFDDVFEVNKYLKNLV